MTPAEFAARLALGAAAATDARRAALLDGATRILATIHDAIGTMDGVPGGAGWPELADSTLDHKARLGQLGRVSEEDILLATGAFRDSWRIDATDPDAPVVTSDSPYAAALEYGTAHMPARPLLAPAIALHATAIAAAVQCAAGDAFRAAMQRPGG